MYYSIFFIVIFYALIFFVGYLASMKAKKAESSSEGLFLAGRNMPYWIGLLTMTATWVGGGYINGTAESVYASGMIWTQAPWGYALSLIIGGMFFAVPMRKARYTTLLDPFEKHYGKATSSILFIPALIGDIFWSSAILTALGYTFSTILQVDVTWSIVISAAIAIAYTALGGLWSVAYTDVVQIIFIGIGLFIAAPIIIYFNGGLASISESYLSFHGSNAYPLPDKEAWRGLFGTSGSEWGKSIWTWVDTGLLLIFGGIPWGVYFQRVLSAPSAKAAQKLSYGAGVLCFFMAIPAVLIGMTGQAVQWDAFVPTKPEGALILPYVLYYAAPKWVGIMGLSVIAAAVMSSIDSSILSSASMFTWNIYKPWRNKTCSQKEITTVTRAAVIAIGVCATLLALRVKSVYALWFLCADLVYVILFPQLVAVLFFKNVTREAALIGFACGLLFRLGGGETSLGIPIFMPYPWTNFDLMVTDFPIRTFSMIMSLSAIFFSKFAQAKLGIKSQSHLPIESTTQKI